MEKKPLWISHIYNGTQHKIEVPYFSLWYIYARWSLFLKVDTFFILSSWWGSPFSCKPSHQNSDSSNLYGTYTTHWNNLIYIYIYIYTSWQIYSNIYIYVCVCVCVCMCVCVCVYTAFEIWKRNHLINGRQWGKIYSPQNRLTLMTPFSVNNSQ